MNDNAVYIVLQNEKDSQVIYDKLIQDLDKEYQKFFNRKAPYNKNVEFTPDDPEEDGHWESFYVKAEQMGMDAVIEMGLREDDAEIMFEDFWDTANIAEDDSEIDKEYQKLVVKYSKKYNKIIPEVANVICRIRLQMSDKYVYGVNGR